MEQDMKKEQVKLEEAKRVEEISEKQGIFYCTKQDLCYPRNLKSIANIPPILYYKGNISILNERKNVAVVGTRNPSAEGARLSFETGRAVAREDMNLVNGLALGCDTEALRGALSAGGKCIVILPAGIDQIVPKSNQKLAEEIVDSGGCLISEYPIGTSPRKYAYVERDRLQSGVSQCVLVVEAKEGSGTMHTADYAIRQYRRLYCYAYELMKYSSGNKLLESSGNAQVIREKGDLSRILYEIKQEKEFEQMELQF